MIRFVAFGGAGMVSSGLGITILFALKMAGMDTYTANTIAYTIGMAALFLMLRYGVFTDSPLRSRDQIIRFTVISVIGLPVANTIILATEPHIGLMGALVVSTGIGYIWKWFANRYWAFSLQN
jgi:putative flippase GtrA